MARLNPNEQEYLHGLNNEVMSNINNAIDLLCKSKYLLERCEVYTLEISAINDRISQAMTMAISARIRSGKFREEISSGEISTEGFY